jgi:signal transduction histidine kinase
LSHFGCDADKTASVIQKSFIEVATIIRTSKESSGCRILYIAAPLSQELAALLKDLVAIFVLLLIPIIGGLVSVTWWWQKALSRTELKLKDAELKAMNAERAKEAAVANMAQNVAHDIKNPLAIFEFARLAKSWAEFTALRESMTQSLDSIYIILADLGRKDSSLVLRRSKTILNFPSIVTDLTRILSTVTSAKLTANGPDSVTVILDWVKIERVLSNLIRNAAEAGAKNIHMGWECHDSDLLISVSDDGPGIPPEVLGRLFQRGNTKGKEDGTGIGLYNVKAITEAHRGKVEHSRENGRTIFKVLLPGVIWNDEMAHEAEEQEIASPPEDLGPLIRPYALVMLSNRERQNAIIRAVNALGIEARHEEDPEAWPMIFYTDDFRLIGRFPGSHVTSTNDIGDKPIEQAAKTIVQVVRFRMRDASAVKENDLS